MWGELRFWDRLFLPVVTTSKPQFIVRVLSLCSPALRQNQYPNSSAFTDGRSADWITKREDDVWAFTPPSARAPGWGWQRESGLLTNLRALVTSKLLTHRWNEGNAAIMPRNLAMLHKDFIVPGTLPSPASKGWSAQQNLEKKNEREKKTI